jgi:hypothetical protein
MTHTSSLNVSSLSMCDFRWDDKNIVQLASSYSSSLVYLTYQSNADWCYFFLVGVALVPNLKQTTPFLGVLIIMFMSVPSNWIVLVLLLLCLWLVAWLIIALVALSLILVVILVVILLVASLVILLVASLVASLVALLYLLTLSWMSST